MDEFVKVWKENEFKMLPSFLAFYMLQSLFPSLSIILILTRIFNVPDEVLLSIISGLLPNVSSLKILEFLQNNINEGFSIVINIFSIHIIARAIKKISYSINKIYKLPQLSFIYSYLKAYVFTFLLLISTSILITIIFTFTYYFQSMLTSIILYPILIIYLFVVLLTMFHFLPSIRQKYQDIYPGALIVSVLIALLLSILPILNNKFIRFDSIYGSLSWIMVLLFLMHVIAYLIYLGILLNSIYVRKRTAIYIHKK